MTDAEAAERDRGIARAKANPKNHYEAICDLVRGWLLDVPIGRLVVAGEAYEVAMNLDPSLKPQEPRVMGAVMRRMAKEGLLQRAGMSTRARSHRGFAREWKRIEVKA